MTDNSNSSGQAVGLQPGAKIGKYEVQQRLAMGGQAIIYKCIDPMLDRVVAIKQISSHLAEDTKFLDRFRKEAKILAKLGSTQPAVVTIHELVEDERGLFIVMEYVEGPSLEKVLADTAGPVEPKAVLQVRWRLAAALHDVHDAGVIHRDIKPANIIICPGLRPKITDFGVAASLTGQTSLVMGTTKYMAPELYEDGPVDARADLYSLGFIAYEMLVGREKFNELFADVISDSHAERLRWMKWHGNASVTAPPAAEVNSNVPKGLSEIVSKMIAKDPDQRFASMEELGRAIKLGFSRKVGSKAPVGGSGQSRSTGRPGSKVTSPPTRQPIHEAAGGPGIGPEDEGDQLEIEEPATAPLPQSRLSMTTKLILAGVVALGIIAIGVGVGVRNHMRSEQRKAQAGQAFVAAQDLYEQGDYAAALPTLMDVNSRFPQTRPGTMAGVLGHMAAAHLAVEAGDWEKVRDRQAQASEALRRLQRSARQGSNLHQWTQDTFAEISDFEKAWVVVRGFREALAEARTLLGEGEYDKARNVLKEKVTALPAMPREYEDQYYAFLSEVDRREFEAGFARLRAEAARLSEQGQFARAGEVLDEARRMLETSSVQEALSADQRRQLRDELGDRLAELKVDIAVGEAMEQARAARSAGDLAAELSALQEAVGIRPTPELRKRIRSVQAAIFLQRGKDALAEGDVPAARDLFERARQVDPNNPQASEQLANLQQSARRAELMAKGLAAQEAGKYDEALTIYEQAARIGLDAELNAYMTETRYQLELSRGDALRDAGQYDQAASAYEKALTIAPTKAAEIRARQGDLDQRRRYDNFLTLGEAERQQGKWKAARDYYEQARAILPTPRVAQLIELTKYNENLEKGRQAMQAGDLAAALGYFRIAQKSRDTVEVQELITELEERNRTGG